MSKRKKGEVPYSTTLPPQVVERVREEARARRVSQKQVVFSALMDFFSPDGEEREVLSRRLSRIEGRQKALTEEVAVVGETLGLFIQVWFSNTEELPESEKAQAGVQGEKRYRRFLEALERRLSEEPGGHA